jgi:DNA polymerase-3 subunit gamma/tau
MAPTPPADKPSAAWPTVAQTGADEKSARPATPTHEPARTPQSSTQQPSAQPRSGQTAEAPAGAIDAAAVRRVWSDVLDAVRLLKRTPHALLLNAQVTAVTDTTITVSFNSAALARQFDQGVNRDLLSQALREVLGVEWTVTTAVQGAEPQLPSAQAEFAAGDAPADEEPADPPVDGEPERASARVSGEDAAMALLKSGLGAHVIGEVDKG